ncbi:MAG: L,D-transpeptidase family protein [Alistipes sp.]|nr:L,D-transpeptidase family protein [Alistipes sp.]
MKFNYLFVVALLALFATTSCATTQQKPKEQKDEEMELFEDEFESEEYDGEEFGSECDEDFADGSGDIALDGNPEDAHHIVISKESMTLNLFDSQGGLIYSFPIAVGKNYGNKKESGDFKTPEGEFTVQQIQDASTWGHDFKDGKGRIEGAYGNWFIRLKTPPHTGIGIHGTHDPNSIGTRATEGCIRLNNADLDKLKPLVKLGMKVTIESSILDMEADGKIDPSSAAKDGISNNEEDELFEDLKKDEQQPSAEESAQDASAVYHTVESGDTFSSLAVKYETTTAKIEELNPDVDPRKIRPGQKILVKGNASAASSETKKEEPAKKAENSAASEDEAVYHIIVSGDMFGKLAEQYGTTSKKIEELNPNLNPNNLQLGTKVRVK